MRQNQELDSPHDNASRQQHQQQQRAQEQLKKPRRRALKEKPKGVPGQKKEFVPKNFKGAAVKKNQWTPKRQKASAADKDAGDDVELEEFGGGGREREGRHRRQRRSAETSSSSSDEEKPDGQKDRSSRDGEGIRSERIEPSTSFKPSSAAVGRGVQTGGMGRGSSSRPRADSYDDSGGGAGRGADSHGSEGNDTNDGQGYGEEDQRDCGVSDDDNGDADDAAQDCAAGDVVGVGQEGDEGEKGEGEGEAVANKRTADYSSHSTHPKPRQPSSSHLPSTPPPNEQAVPMPTTGGDPLQHLRSLSSAYGISEEVFRVLEGEGLADDDLQALEASEIEELGVSSEQATLIVRAVRGGQVPTTNSPDSGGGASKLSRLRALADEFRIDEETIVKLEMEGVAATACDLFTIQKSSSYRVRKKSLDENDLSEMDKSDYKDLGIKLGQALRLLKASKAMMAAAAQAVPQQQQKATPSESRRGESGELKNAEKQAVTPAPTQQPTMSPTPLPTPSPTPQPTTTPEPTRSPTRPRPLFEKMQGVWESVDGSIHKLDADGNVCSADEEKKSVSSAWGCLKAASIPKQQISTARSRSLAVQSGGILTVNMTVFGDDGVYTAKVGMEVVKRGRQDAIVLQLLWSDGDKWTMRPPDEDKSTAAGKGAGGVGAVADMMDKMMSRSSKKKNKAEGESGGVDKASSAYQQKTRQNVVEEEAGGERKLKKKKKTKKTGDDDDRPPSLLDGMRALGLGSRTAADDEEGGEEKGKIKMQQNKSGSLEIADTAEAMRLGRKERIVREKALEEKRRRAEMLKASKESLSASWGGDTNADPMAKQVKVETLTLSAGEKVLLSECRLNLLCERGFRYGLVGPNGMGKSTLLNAISSRAIPVPSYLEIGLISQEAPISNKSAVQVVMASDLRVQKLEEEKNVIQQKLDRNEGGLDAQDDDGKLRALHCCL
eukprot:jgi/Bigna1/146474/aug1.115_g21182